jgi:hypothetical protein
MRRPRQGVCLPGPWAGPGMPDGGLRRASLAAGTLRGWAGLRLESADIFGRAQLENWKMVEVLYTWPGFSSVVGKLGWFGEFGKCCVSNV